MVDVTKLKEFLKKAKRNTYAGGKRPEKKGDGSDIFKFTSSDFEGFAYEDVYFGDKKFSGQEIVKHNGVIVWTMVYYGGIIKEILTEDTLYNRFLKKFLSNLDGILARGQDSQTAKNGNDIIIYHNINTENKDIRHFRGREFVLHNGKIIYELFYSGGIIEID